MADHTGLLGKEDCKIQENSNDPETFDRRTSTGGTVELYKIPDIWGGEGKPKVAYVYTSKGYFITHGWEEDYILSTW